MTESAVRRLTRRAAVLGLAVSSAAAGGVVRAETRAPDELVFDDWPGPPIVAPHFRPASATRDAPILFVMHGVARGAHGYLAAWRDLAEARGWVLAAPKFDKAAFPGADGYQIGASDDPSTGSHAAIEPLFDALRGRLGLTRERYWMYGHSAGSQFAHRFLFRTGGPRLERAVCANAGWYFMPDPEAPFPYGLAGAGAAAASIEAALGRRLVVLLGEADLGRDGSLRQTAGAEAQGRNRLARGRAFFAAARRLAAARGVPFRWRLATAPGVGHSNAKMAPFAAEALAAV